MVKFPNHRHELSVDKRDHIIREWCDWHDPSDSLALWSFSLLLLLSTYTCSYDGEIMQLPNTEGTLSVLSNITSNLVTIKMLYRCLWWCLLSWHRSRLGFVTLCIGEVSLGPVGNAHHYKALQGMWLMS